MYKIRVQVTGFIDVDVHAEDEDEAAEIVEYMSAADLGMEGLEDLEIEIIDVTECDFYDVDVDVEFEDIDSTDESED